jgi:hypothetical protein
MLRIERMNYGIGAVLALASLLTQSRSIALGICVGVALTCLNFFVLRKLITKWTTAAQSGKSSSAPLLMLPKMTGLMLAVAAAVLFLPIDAIAFVIGYSIFILSIVVETIYCSVVVTEHANGSHDG